MLLLVKLKVALIYGCFSRFLNCANGTKLRKASHIVTDVLVLHVVTICEITPPGYKMAFCIS